jgi:tetratricopeptide (TPR) repeat protein
MKSNFVLKNMNCLVLILLVTSMLLCNQLPVFAQTLTFAPQEKSLIDVQLVGAKTYAREGRYNEAEALYKEIIKVEPTNTMAQFGLGKAYLFEKKYDEAKICYEEVGRLGIPEELLPAYLFNLSLIYVGLGNNQEAISALRKCLSIKPDYKGAKELLGMIEEAYKRDGNNTMITIGRARP